MFSSSSVSEETPFSRDEPEVSEESPDERGKDRPILMYIKRVTSLVEGRQVGLREILDVIEHRLRQHGIDQWGISSYFTQTSRGQPP